MSDRMPEDMSDRMPEDMSEYMPEDMPDRMPEDMSDRVPEDVPDRMPEDLPDRMPEDMPEDMPDHMPEDMPVRMSNRMSEDMSDRMPEDLPVRKCINVMVGITRSKVILSLPFSIHITSLRCWGASCVTVQCGSKSRTYAVLHMFVVSSQIDKMSTLTMCNVKLDRVPWYQHSLGQCWPLFSLPNHRKRTACKGA